MRDGCVRIRGLEPVEDCLVGDLAREAHVARRDGRGGAAHQHPPPVRGGPRDVGDAGRGRPGEEADQRLCGIRQHQRARVQRAEVDLQPAVAPDVVEGGPDDLGRRRAIGERGGEARQIVLHELRCTGGTGSEENPLGLTRARPPHRVGLERRPGIDRDPDADLAARRRAAGILHAGIGCGARDDGRQVFGGEPGRQEHHAPRHPVELGDRESRGELICHGEQHRTAAQLLEPPAEDRGVRKPGERDPAATAVERAGGRSGGRDRVPQRARLTWQGLRTG